MKITITIEPARIGDGWDLLILDEVALWNSTRRDVLARLVSHIDAKLDAEEAAEVHPPDTKIPW